MRKAHEKYNTDHFTHFFSTLDCARAERKPTQKSQTELNAHAHTHSETDTRFLSGVGCRRIEKKENLKARSERKLQPRHD